MEIKEDASSCSRLCALRLAMHCFHPWTGLPWLKKNFLSPFGTLDSEVTVNNINNLFFKKSQIHEVIHIPMIKDGLS